MNEQKEKNLRDKMLPEDEVPYTKERGLLFGEFAISENQRKL